MRKSNRKVFGMEKRRFGIVNNGFMETVYNIDNGEIVCQVLLEEKSDAFSIIKKMSVDDDIQVVSYGCY